MKRFIAFCLLLVVSSCYKGENLSPALGNATFSLSVKARSGGRTSETATPAFVLLNIKDGNGVQNSKKIPLFPFDQSYISETLPLQTGSYQLTEFAVLDAANKVIYCAPLEGSALAKYVANPLPINFTVSNTTTQVITPVLAITSDDTPESFGLAGFAFEVVARTIQLHSEEIFLHDPSSSTSTDGFVRSLKKTYTYAQDKLVQIDIYEYNPTTNSYDPGNKYEEYHYDSKGKLAQRIKFLPNGIKWIHTYVYLNDNRTKVVRQEYYNDRPIGQPDWWFMQKGISSLTVTYYHLNDDLYAELNYEMDGKGNVTSKERTQAEKTYYTYDHSPNPYRFLALGGEFGVDAEKYLSLNNMIGQSPDPNPKSTRIIEYNKEGYPVVITAPASSKRILTYQ